MLSRVTQSTATSGERSTINPMLIHNSSKLERNSSKFLQHYYSEDEDDKISSTSAGIAGSGTLEISFAYLKSSIKFESESSACVRYSCILVFIFIIVAFTIVFGWSISNQTDEIHMNFCGENINDNDIRNFVSIRFEDNFDLSSLTLDYSDLYLKCLPPQLFSHLTLSHKICCQK